MVWEVGPGGRGQIMTEPPVPPPRLHSAVLVPSPPTPYSTHPILILLLGPMLWPAAPEEARGGRPAARVHDANAQRRQQQLPSRGQRLPGRGGGTRARLVAAVPLFSALPLVTYTLARGTSHRKAQATSSGGGRCAASGHPGCTDLSLLLVRFLLPCILCHGVCFC